MPLCTASAQGIKIYLYNIRAIEQATMPYLASILLSPQSQVGHAVAKHPTCILTGIITASVGCTIILTVTNYDEGACFTCSLLLHLHATLLECRWSVYLMKIVILSNSSCTLMRFDAHVLTGSSWGGRLITHTCNFISV